MFWLIETVITNSQDLKITITYKTVQTAIDNTISHSAVTVALPTNESIQLFQ